SLLAHELRHHWQHQELGLKTWVDYQQLRTEKPLFSFFLRRVTEADAYAFEDRFKERLAGEKTLQTKENNFLDFLQFLSNKKYTEVYDPPHARLIYKAC